MVVRSKLYPHDWNKVLRRQQLARAGYRCELCGLPDGTEKVNPRESHPFFPDGKPSRVWLQVAHKQHYRTWDRQADTVVLCPSCHGKFDRVYRRRHLSGFSPVGRVVVYVYIDDQRLLASDSAAFDDLFGVIATFPVGAIFDLCPEMLLARVGAGRYRRIELGVMVIDEQGACEGFGVLLHEVLQGVVS